MENLPAQQKQPESFSQQVSVALQSKPLSQCSDEEVKEAMRYGIMLIGIPEDRHGDDLSKLLAVNYLRTAFPMIRVDELRLAFDHAVKCGDPKKVKIDLYPGEFFSGRYASDIVKFYLDEKKKDRKKLLQAATQGVQMNNLQRVAGIVSHLKPEVKSAIDDMVAKDGQKNKMKREKLPYHDLHQRWLSQFDRLYRRYADDSMKSGRWIRRYGLLLNIDAFCNKKADQLFLSRVRAEFPGFKIAKIEIKKRIELLEGQFLIDGDHQTYKIILTPIMNI